MNLYCLHGFLGKPSDWLALNLEAIPDVKPHYIDLFHDPNLPVTSLNEWAVNFNRETMRRNQANTPSILLGYSMGGRLALHALLQNPSAYQGAILVSVNPGLSEERQRKERLKNDYDWANAFASEPWAPLIERWNAQPVFRSDPTPQRLEKEFDRAVLAKAFRHWSLGHQDDLTDTLSRINLPILWVVGELDTPYRLASKNITLRHPLSNVWIAEQCGHRVVWQTSSEFRARSISFINSILPSGVARC